VNKLDRIDPLHLFQQNGANQPVKIRARDKTHGKPSRRNALIIGKTRQCLQARFHLPRRGIVVVQWPL
jgi:hypothetical protein